MGRKPTRNKNLPSGMRARHRGKEVYYYLDSGGRPRKEIPLGKDYTAAVMKWAELTMSAAPSNAQITFRYVAERYTREVIPSKAAATRKDNLRELAQLYKFFDDPPAPLDSIEPINIRQYLDWRKAAKVRANREKALFSHIWNFAREVGLTNKPNPCAGIRGYKETGRDAYIDDDVYKAVWDAAEEPLRDALDLAYLTGQRHADVLKLSQAAPKNGALWIEQNKARLPHERHYPAQRIRPRQGCRGKSQARNGIGNEGIPVPRLTRQGWNGQRRAGRSSRGKRSAWTFDRNHDCALCPTPPRQAGQADKIMSEIISAIHNMKKFAL